jgi:5'-nucleotidase
VDRTRPGGASARVLVTNDDGIDAPGLRTLATALALDHDVLVVAPDHDVSGAGTSIGRIDPAEPARVRRSDLDGVEAYAIAGPPGLAVMSAALGAFGPRPDLVVSGVNAGMNTGTTIVHSGTVGAALTAHTFGISGVAVSLAPGARWEWDTTVPVARAVARWVRQRPTVTTVNVNVPALPPSRVRGSRWAPVDRFGHFSVASTRREGSVLDLDVRDRDTPTDPDCDTARCLAGYVTLTLLSPLAGAPAPSDDADVVAGTAG